MKREILRINGSDFTWTGVTAFFEKDGRRHIAITHIAKARIYAASVEEANEAAELFRTLVGPAMESFLVECGKREFGVRSTHLTAESLFLASGDFEKGNWHAYEDSLPDRVIVVEVEKP